ncbi:phosphotransferase family protein [Penicillium lividum]|nr:phosphotransferase family protein [Penicillium lividum]
MWRKPRSDHDEDWEGNKDISIIWPRRFLDRRVLYEVANLISKYADCEIIDGDSLKILGKAGRNICLRAIPDTGSDAVIRFSLPDVDASPEERLRNEVAVMRYIHDETSMPVPFIFQWGTQEKSLDALGPVMVMEYMDHDRTMSDVSRNPRFPDHFHFPPILDNNVQIEVLERMYRHLADITLQLYMNSFLCVGSLDHVDDFTWEATKRPLSLQINDMALNSNLPESQLPSTIFYTASSYMKALADLHMHNLIHQKHQITSANEFREKFIERKLFQRLAQEKKLTDVTLEDARHTLCCDSLHPTKVLLDGEDLAAVLGWEYKYAAPLEFSHAPPWWLLLEKPELSPSGLEDWQTQFDWRLQNFCAC